MRPEEAGPPEVEEVPAEVPPVPAHYKESFEIGGVTLRGRFLMAPMAGYTNLPFRRIVSAYGAGMVATEMVSSQALVRRHARTFDLMRNHVAEKPVSIQIFGSDPAQLAEAAQIVEEAGADIIDLNCGCPVKKITKNRAGSALLRYPDLAGKAVSAMVRAVRRPVTVKMRSGWDTIGARDAGRFAKAVEEAGAAAITVHGRTRMDMFEGRVDLDTIARVKETVSVPVIGNGSILTPVDAFRMIERTGVDALMIGRGAIGNPWIFSRLAHWLHRGELYPPPDPSEKKRAVLAHMQDLIELLGERHGVFHSRKHLAAYSKGMVGGAAFREKVNRTESYRELKEAVAVFFNRADGGAIGRSFCRERADAA